MGLFGSSYKFAVGKWNINGNFVGIVKEFNTRVMAEQWAKSQFSFSGDIYRGI